MLTEWFIGRCISFDAASTGAAAAAAYHEISYAIARIERFLIDFGVIFSLQLLLLMLQNESIALLKMIGERKSLVFVGR